MGKHEVLINPSTGKPLHGTVVHFVSGNEDLANFGLVLLRIQFQIVAIQKGRWKPIVGAQLLQLAVSFKKGAGIPEANVTGRSRIGSNDLGVEVIFGLEGFDPHFFKVKASRVWVIVR